MLQTHQKLHKRAEHQLRVNIPGEPATLDPRKGGDLVSSTLHFLLFEGLTRLNADSSTSPAQAESIEISEDKKIYTFHLRNCKWSDGSPITAYDFEKSWKDILNPDFPSVNAHLLFPIKNAREAKLGVYSVHEIGITAKDAKTLIVELEKPIPYFLQLTAFCVLFPINHQVDHKFHDWAYHGDERFVCNGPFRFAKWKHDQEIVLEKNPHYWDADKIKLDSIRINMIKDEMTALQMYENDEIDILGLPLSPLPIGSLQELAQKGLLNINPVAGTKVCYYNTERFPFSNLFIRKAFAYAVNRKVMMEHVSDLQEEIATGAIPPLLKSDSALPFFNDGDIWQAKDCLYKGLSELDLKLSDLPDIYLSYSHSESDHKIAHILQQQWLDVLGVKVKLEKLDHNELLEKMAQRDFSIAQYAWLAQYNDQMNILERFKHKDNAKNYTGWEMSEYTECIDLSHRQINSTDRQKTLAQAESLLMAHMPVIPLFHTTFALLIKPFVHDARLSPIGDIYFEKISIHKGAT